MAKRCSAALAARCCLPTTLAVVSMLVAGGARAQTNACDQLKGELAARIDASGARGYALEAVPAGTPVPPGAKAIGTCEAGRYKILYRRWGATLPAAETAGASGPASASPQAVMVPDGPTRRSPSAQRERAGRPSPASALSPASQSVSRSDGPASAVPMPSRVLEKTPVGGASEVATARATNPAVAQPAQVQPDKNVVAKVPLVQQATDFLAEYWIWILVLALLPVAGWLWAWRAHHNAYDEAGLPRGPKL